MRILKTAQFGHHSQSIGDEEGFGPHEGHNAGHSGSDLGLDDLMIDGENIDIQPHEDGETISLQGEGHLGDEGQEHGESLEGHLEDLLHGEHGMDESHPDAEISMHLDAPNDLAGDLPADIDIDPQAFGDDQFGDEDFGGDEYGHDDIGHEGTFADDQPDEDFNDLSLDGDLDGHLDLDDTNDIKPNDEKEDLSGKHFHTEGDEDFPEEDGWSHDFLEDGHDEMPSDLEGDEFDIDGQHGEGDEGGHGGGGFGMGFGDPGGLAGLGDYGSGYGYGYGGRRGGYNRMNDTGGEVGEIDDIGDPSGLDPHHPSFGDGTDSHRDRSKAHKHPRDDFDAFIQ